MFELFHIISLLKSIIAYCVFILFHANSTSVKKEFSLKYLKISVSLKLHSNKREPPNVLSLCIYMSFKDVLLF